MYALHSCNSKHIGLLTYCYFSWWFWLLGLLRHFRQKAGGRETWGNFSDRGVDTFLLAVSQLVRRNLKPRVGTSDWSQWTCLRSHLEINKTFLLFLDAVCLLLLSCNAKGKYQGDYFNLLSSSVVHHTHDSVAPCSEDSLGVGLAAVIHTYPSPWASQYPGVWVEGDKTEASEG